MKTGQNERARVSDSLAGANQVVPAARPSAGLSVSAAPVPDVAQSFTSRLGSSLNAWASEALQTAANKEHEKSILDGQMAYQQGKAIDDVEMEGNKWALQGYRVMQAQTISSSMLAAQQELIRQKGYQDDPDTFRAQYVNQLEQQINGLDERTGRMVRETMSKQMPVLVQEHTKAHLAYQEGEAFKALSYSIDTVSKDATATEQLIAAASGGAGSVSSGLSDDRRNKAVAEGVIRAFENGNAQAYSKLKQAGVLDNLSNTDKQAIDNARNRYQSDLRSEYNEKFIAERDSLVREIATGALTGKQSMEAFAKLYAEHGMDIDATEANAAYVAAEDAITYELEGDGYLLKQAKAMGDTDAIEYLENKIAKQGGPRPADAKTRADTIQKAMQELEEQSDLAATEEMRLSQIAIDARLENQEISKDEYIRLSRENRNAFGVKQSAAITGHMISTITKAHKANRDKVDENKREALDAQFELVKAKFKSEVSREGVTPAEANRLTTEYQNNVVEMYAANGVSLKDMGYASITADAAALYYTAEADGIEYQQNRRLQEWSARTGTISEMSVKDQREYWQNKSKDIVAQISGEIDKGAITEDDAVALMQTSLLAAYVSAGAVDPQTRAEAIAVLGQDELVSSDGKVNPNVVDTVRNYVTLKENDTRVADSMLDSRTQLIAEQIIEASGGIGGNIQDGVLRYNDARQKIGGFEENKPEITEATIKRANKAVKSYLARKDVGIIQAIFSEATIDQTKDRTGQERKALRSEETQELFANQVLAETTRLSFLDPGSDPRLMVKAAMDNVARRTDFIGDTPVIMEPGKGMKEQLFGASVSQMDKPDVVNEVIIDHLRGLAELPGNEFIKEVGTGAQLLSNLGEAIGVDVDRPVIGAGELIDISRRGVRPFTVLSDGKNVAVRIRTETGALSEPIALDLPKIGEAYMKKYKNNISKRAWE